MYLSHWTWHLKDTTDSINSASYIDIHLEIDSDDRLREYFNFFIVNFPYIHRCIPAVTAYGVYIYLSVDIPVFMVCIKISLVEGAANKESTEQKVPSG